MTDTRSGALPLIDNLADAIARKLGMIEVTQAGVKLSLPLSRVDIHSQVVDRCADVRMVQTFTNPYTEFLEAVYTFPLSGGIAVNHFEMKIKDRVVVGAVEERQEARQQYAKAVQEGRRAALLEQERDDVFTVQLGNLPPGETVEITLKYAERLPFFRQGMTELRLPTVVAPRYIPGSPSDVQTVGHGVEVDTDIVPDASRISPPRLAKGIDSGVRLSITVELAVDSAATVSDLSCSQHATSTSMRPGWVTISLSRTDELLNRDFVLTWRLATSQDVRSQLFIYRPEDGSQKAYALLSIIPPRQDGFTGVPRDIVFVLDRSGSMAGIKMSSAIRSCSILLETLSPDDRFSVVAFDNTCEWMGQAGTFHQANEDGISRGHTFLRTIGARGGTELDQAIEQALQAISKRDEAQSRVPIVVVITDGQIGDESRVLKRIQTQLGSNRVFTIGIDTAVNSGFLKRLAALGGGTCALVQPGAQLETALIQIGREISVPLVTDIELVSSKKWKAEQVTPDPLPDLFAGRAVTAFFRLNGTGDHLALEVKGKCPDGKTFCDKVSGVAVDNESIAKLWAKSLIMQLEDQFRGGPTNLFRGGAGHHPSQVAAIDIQKLRKEIVELSKEHQLLTKFTAFVLVDQQEIVNQTGTHKVIVQPVCQPEGWDMDANQSANASMRRYGASIQQIGGSNPNSGSVGWGAPGGAGSLGGEHYGCALPASQSQPGWAPPAPAQPAPAASTGANQAQTDSLMKRRAAMAPENAHLEASIMQDMSNLSKEFLGANSPNAPTPSSPNISSTGAPNISTPRSPSAPGASPQQFLASLWTTALDQIQRTPHPGFGAEYTRFLEVFAAIVKALEAGNKPDAKALIEGRDLLLKALSSSPAAVEIPLLQRFLRVELSELIAVMTSDKATKEDIARVVENCKKALEESNCELQVKLKLDRGVLSGNFWEATV